MAWHDNANKRKHGGDEAEKLFARQVRCHCGSEFEFVGDKMPGYPDFACVNCNQFVDVKSSPQAEQTGNIAVSFKPWQHYPDEMLLATYIHHKWIGQYKSFIRVKDAAPRDPTHHSGHARLKNTQWLLLSWKQFRSLAELGYQVEDRPVKNPQMKRSRAPEPEARSHDTESNQMTFDW